MKAILSVDDGKAYLQNADTNAYLEARFENIDVSGPIDTHNSSDTAHSDIRAAVSNAQATADGKATMAQVNAAIEAAIGSAIGGGY